MVQEGSACFNISDTIIHCTYLLLSYAHGAPWSHQKSMIDIKAVNELNTLAQLKSKPH